jgi:glucose dehydrogenase
MTRLISILFLLHAAISAFAQQQGTDVFGASCARCHAPVEIQRRLSLDWAGRGADQLFQQVRRTMPGEAPGSLGDDDYVDAIAYMLDIAGIPRPDGELTQAQLQDIALTVPPQTEVLVADVPWQNFGGELNAQRYAPLDQINADNAQDLEIAWRWTAANFGPQPEIRNASMPIMQDGKVFIGAGATRNVVAIDAGSGQTLWMWRPVEGERYAQAARKDSGKGVSYWAGEDGRKRVIVVTPGYYLVSLNAETGIPDDEFGAGGWVDLTVGMRRAADRELDVGLTVPA